jgi:SAM-dependent methyltransferase
MRADELCSFLASLPPSARDAALERYLRLGDADDAAPGEHQIGYHPSGVAPIVRALIGAPVTADDVFVDIGSGLGKAVLLARLLTGATARGIEIQPALVHRARRAAARVGVDVYFTCDEARRADLDDGTVFFLYAPFTGPVLAEVMARIEAVARRRAIVICALGLDLPRGATWLRARPTDAFWLTIYDAALPGSAPRPAAARPPLSSEAAFAIAWERSRDLPRSG